MKININGKNLQVGERTKEIINSKLAKLEKFFNSEVEIFVKLSHVKATNICEITIPLKNGVFIRAEEEADNMDFAIDDAVNKIIRQIRKHKTNMQKKFRKNESIRFDMIPEVSFDTGFETHTEEENEFKIVKNKKFSVKPMQPEEAVLQMNMLNHDFYVFMNSESHELNVVYRRKDGKFGLIEPEVK